MTMRKKLLAALTSCCLLLVGCTHETVVSQQQNRTEIKLSWWGNDTRTEYTIEGVRKFEELHHDIKVNISYSEWSGYEARNRIQMVSATEADVMQINFGWLPEYSPDGSGYYDLAKLGDMINLNAFDQDMINYGRRNGVINAIPIAMNAETIYINRTIYEKYGLGIPETWEDFEQAAAVMSKDGIFPLSGASKSIWLLTIAYAEQTTGKQFLRENGALNFNADDMQIMLDFYDRMVDEKVFPPVEYFDRLSIDNGIYAGSVAWVSDAGNYYKKAIENGNDIVAAPYPHDAAHKSGDGWYAKPATLYAISKNTDHPKESAMLLDFLLNSAEMAELQGVEKGVPLSSKARETLLEKDMLNGLQYEASLNMEENKNIEQMNSYLEDSNLIDLFIAACDQVIFDKASSEDAAKLLYQDIRKSSRK